MTTFVDAKEMFVVRHHTPHHRACVIMQALRNNSNPEEHFDDQDHWFVKVTSRAIN